MIELGTLAWQPASPDLLAAPVAAALAGWSRADDVAVAAIDAELADTAAFCERYQVAEADSANYRRPISFLSLQNR